MKHPGIFSRRAAAIALSAGLVALAAACGSSPSTGSTGSSSGSSDSITVAVAYPAPPAALLAQFTKQTGIKVNWVNIGWDNLQTKIAAAAAANTYFADAADVDWSKVGEYQKTGWFYPWALNVSFSTLSGADSSPAHYFPSPLVGTSQRSVLGIGGAGNGVSEELGRSLLNSVIESGGAMIVTVVIAIFAAYAFARLQFRFKRVIFGSVLASRA